MTGGGSIKIVVVGDSGVGKTNMLHQFVYGEYGASYKPTVFDSYAVAHEQAGTSYVLSIFDTSGQEELSGVRSLSYIGCDVFVICFSVVSPKSYKGVEATWSAEIGRKCSGVPKVLVGLQTDLRGKEDGTIGRRDRLNTDGHNTLEEPKKKNYIGGGGCQKQIEKRQNTMNKSMDDVRSIDTSGGNTDTLPRGTVLYTGRRRSSHTRAIAYTRKKSEDVIGTDATELTDKLVKKTITMKKDNDTKSGDSSVIWQDRGERMMARIGASTYVECYRDQADGVRSVIDSAVAAALAGGAESTQNCSCVVM